MKFKSILPLLAAGAVTVLAVAGLSNAASSAAPVNTTEPKISGTAQEGETLTASTGSWTSTGGSVTYSNQWRRCNAQGAGCSNISGADGSSYLVKHADVGDTIRVRVTAKNSDGSSQATSNETAVVKAKSATPAPPAANGCPTGTGVVDVAQISLPARLVIDGQSVSPTTVTRSTNDLTMRFHVSACGGRPVSGALLYATAVPFNQFSIAPEAPTGSDGWATVTEHKQIGFPASAHQQLLAVFVRARKSGENTLGGVSTRLLVSFPVNLRG
jgi:hypothetical protein